MATAKTDFLCRLLYYSIKCTLPTYGPESLPYHTVEQDFKCQTHFDNDQSFISPYRHCLAYP